MTTRHKTFCSALCAFKTLLFALCVQNITVCSAHSERWLHLKNNSGFEHRTQKSLSNSIMLCYKTSVKTVLKLDSVIFLETGYENRRFSLTRLFHQPIWVKYSPNKHQNAGLGKLTKSLLIRCRLKFATQFKQSVFTGLFCLVPVCNIKFVVTTDTIELFYILNLLVLSTLAKSH